MKAVVFHGIGDIRLDDVPEPKIQEPTDAVVRLTSSAICGTDLHMIRATMAGMKEGTILGHEGVGIVEEVGPQARNLNTGDRVVIGSTAGCGYCSYCRAAYFAQCDNANPNGPQAGTAFFGGPETTGSIDGMQAEYARVPYASVTCVKLPENVSEEQFEQETDQVAPETNPQGDNWHPGGAPSQSARWTSEAVCKAGTIGVIGVFPPQAMNFPVGALQQRNLTVRGGNCNHRRYIPKLVGLVATGDVDPTEILTQREPAIGAIEAYEAFDQRQPGWIKVELLPEAG